MPGEQESDQEFDGSRVSLSADHNYSLAGEKYKTLATVEKIYHKLYDAKMDRRGVIVALGGGVVGDVAGFVASSYLRGVDLVPSSYHTTLPSRQQCRGQSWGQLSAGGKITYRRFLSAESGCDRPNYTE